MPGAIAVAIKINVRRFISLMHDSKSASTTNPSSPTSSRTGASIATSALLDVTRIGSPTIDNAIRKYGFGAFLTRKTNCIYDGQSP